MSSPWKTTLFIVVFICKILSIMGVRFPWILAVFMSVFGPFRMEMSSCFISEHLFVNNTSVTFFLILFIPRHFFQLLFQPSQPPETSYPSRLFDLSKTTLAIGPIAILLDKLLSPPRVLWGFPPTLLDQLPLPSAHTWSNPVSNKIIRVHPPFLQPVVTMSQPLSGSSTDSGHLWMQICFSYFSEVSNLSSGWDGSRGTKSLTCACRNQAPELK